MVERRGEEVGRKKRFEGAAGGVRRARAVALPYLGQPKAESDAQLVSSNSYSTVESAEFIYLVCLVYLVYR